MEHEIPYWTFPFILKLSDEYIPEILEIIYDGILKRTQQACRIVWDAEKKDGIAEEFHRCLVRFILENFMR